MIELVFQMVPPITKLLTVKEIQILQFFGRLIFATWVKDICISDRSFQKTTLTHNGHKVHQESRSNEIGENDRK